jgi:carboxyl-terminal processing protease
MHPRTWLALLTLPLVGAFTYPVLFRGQAPQARAQASPDPLQDLADVQDVLALVRDNYVDPPDMVKVVSGGIQAALERAHPMNAYLGPEDLRLPDPGPADPGLRLMKRGIYAQVLAVLPDSPAERAGILPGDMVRKIDGDSIGAMSAWTMERRLRGPEGSEILLTRFAAQSGDVKKATLHRAILKPASIGVRKEAGAVVVTLPDLQTGRSAELTRTLGQLDHALTLVLDLRRCLGGEPAEAAKCAGLFLKVDPFATLQEAGKADQPLSMVSNPLPAFARTALLLGTGTQGAPELLASAIRKQGIPTFGDRSAGLAVERNRFLLRQGGAVELVNKRWVGAGGEKLDRQGVVPQYPLKGLKPEDDPLPKVLEILAKPPAERDAKEVPATPVRPPVAPH